MGGNDGNHTNDVFMLDTKRDLVKKVAKGGQIMFSLNNNACVQIGEGKVAALVYGANDEQPHLIEYA